MNLWHYIQHSPALPNAWDVTAVELDPCMVEIASKYFSVDCEQILIMIGDGLAIHCTNNDNNGDSSTLQTEIEAKDTNNNIGTDDNAPLGFEAASLDVIVLDVDSKDSGSGMSCPPAGFVEVEYLGKLSSLLRQDTGVLAINVSARDPSLFAATCQTVLSVFPSVYLSKKGYGSVKKDTDVDNEGMYDSDVDETDLNVVVFATFRQSLPSYQKMADNLERRMREIHLVKDESKGVDEIVLSDLCSCLEDFTTCNIEDETNSNPGETKSQRKKTGNSKRRNTKRGSHKKR